LSHVDISHISVADAVKQTISDVMASKKVKRHVGNWCMQNEGYQNLLEIHSYTIELVSPYIRWHNYVNRGLLVELFDILLGANPGHLHHVWPFYNQWRSRGGRYPYTYGERIFGETGEINQWRQAVELLRADKTTRHAYITIRRPNDITEEYTPCSIGLFFHINHEGKLDMEWLMRSNDLDVGGLLRNLFIAAHLHEQMSLSTGIPIGNYYHHDMNVHIYEATYSKVSNLSANLRSFVGQETPAKLLTDFDKGFINSTLDNYFLYHKLPDEDNPFFSRHEYYGALLRYILKIPTRWEINEIQWLEANKPKEAQ
jgi:thymidylate synthase